MTTKTQTATDKAAYRIKDWNKFQHFKDRNPPWIKLYKELIDDPDWHALDSKSAKILVMLWIIASECKELEGNLPPIRTIAFRLRLPESAIIDAFTKLSHYLIQPDINTISTRYQVDAPETETKGETKREEETKGVFVPSDIKKPYGEFNNVKLTADELQKLRDIHGDYTLKKGICCLGDWMQSTGKSRKDHYACLKSNSWVWARVKDDERTKNTDKNGSEYREVGQ